ncbi:MAG TPA: tRNA (guanosine(46)-N7)-methyltransferase TrmB [Candidatus Omnitrophota bacterium]|nr:tRNA (guanosine(46)-N7)-methyltransferase TrmB [Candidatus Omnitrophota bacterium]HPS36364.1 tRNA (guanosine(46)-N7)-methyltransferase TrmB [Candidatus Omnitrophota bacterium]
MARPFVVREREKYPPVVFRELFGNDHPVEVEIGCGKGKFLATRSLENPGINFLGLDRVGKWMKRRIAQTGKRELANIFYKKVEARAFIADAVSEASVSIFHIYFPDPWPKRRQQCRRVVNADLLKLLHAKLLAGGLIEIATDDEDYFTAMKKSIAATAELWENVRETRNERILDGMNKTNYELKWAAQGKTLFYAELRKK